MSEAIAITPEEFDPDVHALPIAGELLLAGATVIIRNDGLAYTHTQVDAQSGRQGYVIELCQPGDIAEITAQTTRELEGGIFISKFWVLALDA
ncbi:MAG: hypothetical protein Q9P01_01205 [Anaerolineae bacterium]|nr:hypothetical protein [Anaerolineae bacterium]MDQ7033481.1 hypothetical protein [Anaerolineae bacterium]